MQAGPQSPSGVRRAEIIASLSLATDIAVGQPMEIALRSCALAMRLGEALGLGEGELGEVYWYSLLHHAGCNADSQAFATLFGDEIAFHRGAAGIDIGRPAELMPFLVGALRRGSAGAPMMGMLAAVANGLISSRNVVAEVIGGHCEVAQKLAGRLGMGPLVIRDLGQAEERWDGRGLPDGLKGDDIVPAVRVANLARDFVVLAASFGNDGAKAKIGERRGRAYDPRSVDRFLAEADSLTSGFDLLRSWDEVLRLEPSPHVELSEAGFDAACEAMADFADLKSPHMNGHSRAVADLARAAARGAGLPAADVAEAFRAGLLHDIGQSAISVGIWDKAGPLSEREWEEVRLHPYYGERVLQRAPALERLGRLVGQHHERIDGSGYYRGTGAAALSPQAGVLAAAEAYRGMIEDRPYRKAMSVERAAAALQSEARAGHLDDAAVAAVLAAAGHTVRGARPQMLAGLTEREIEVLRHLAAGRTTKEIARALGISPKTTDNHIQNLYPKIEVKTRSGATLFAIEHGLGGAFG